MFRALAFRWLFAADGARRFCHAADAAAALMFHFSSCRDTDMLPFDEAPCGLLFSAAEAQRDAPAHADALYAAKSAIPPDA